jgi:hypothetical protein
MRYKVILLTICLFVFTNSAFCGVNFMDYQNQKQAEVEKEKQKELERQLEIEKEKRKELERQLQEAKRLKKEPKEETKKSPLPSLAVDLKVGVSLHGITSTAPESQLYIPKNEDSAQPKIELDIIYFFSKYIGLGVGIEAYHSYTKYGYYGWYDGYGYNEYAWWADSIYATLNARVKNFSGYFAIGSNNKLGLGVDYNIYNFLIGFSFSFSKSRYRSIIFESRALYLTIGYRFNIISART